MSAMASQITSLTIDYSTVYSSRRSKKTSKLRVTGLCEGNSPVAGEFPAQRASKAENVSIWWRHHAQRYCKSILGWYPCISNIPNNWPCAGWWGLLSSWAAVTPVKYECDWNNLTGACKIENFAHGEINERILRKPTPGCQGVTRIDEELYSESLGCMPYASAHPIQYHCPVTRDERHMPESPWFITHTHARKLGSSFLYISWKINFIIMSRIRETCH